MLNVLVHCPETAMQEQIARVLASKNFAMMHAADWAQCLEALSQGDKQDIRMAILALPDESEQQRKAFDQVMQQRGQRPIIFLVDDWFANMELEPLAITEELSVTRLRLPFTSDELNQKIEFLADHIHYGDAAD